MQLLVSLLWIFIFLIFYTYVGYGFLLQFILPKRTKVNLPLSHPSNLPRVAHIIAAYNEEEVIDKKILNALSLDYPKDKMKVIVVTDGSTDRTPTITERYSDVLHLHHSERRGKVSAINRAVQKIRGEYDIIVFSDANTLISKDALMYMILHFVNPRVGGVSGEKVILSQANDMVQGQGEGLYWKYESWLKKLDSDYFSIVGAAGELFSVREKLYDVMQEDIILDDLYLSLLICKKGFIIPYEPKATATELPSYSLEDALMYMILHFVNPRVGGVSGEKVILSQANDMVQGQGEGLYRKYESWLKKLDSDYFSIVGAAGELFSVREKLYEVMQEDVILDDLYLSLLICKKGFIIPYEPKATATELPSYSLEDERNSRIRISAGAFQTMTRLPELLNIFVYGRFSFQYFSHRVLRWAICPLALPLMLFLNLLIIFMGGPLYYIFLLFIQIFFYALALGGVLFSDNKTGMGKLFYIPYYFVFMNISVWKGFFRFIKGTQSVNWEKAQRQSPYL